ncbi:hypothetical protein [Salisediminibacterium halotolerans]|uniref:Uncharacterized protein n=1 Tax=Salisediminibacterium halotolerans TaxID=517425 RepID=A0A1H9VL23_9BACI|nr:hypothetical protein [Salisediminibacterium haloalkalitolerans]SES21903.1 hypothetical protein SAMN05444126_12126 [Salisediminibacterium haloalkalitolerans]
MSRGSIIIVGVILLFLSPAVLFFTQQAEKFDVLIYNNTIPEESLREHASISWTLNHFRYQQRDQSFYSVEEDYYGLTIDADNETVLQRSAVGAPEDADLIYIADTYGVDEEDLPRLNGSVLADTSASALVEGGMKQEEWSEIKRRVTEEQSDIVMEFNSFASPTKSEVREDILQFMRMSWDGWIGRQFTDLDKEDGEVPQWVISRYEDQHGEWGYHQAGFILIDSYSEEVLVLSNEDGDLLHDDLRVHFNEQGRETFALDESSPYSYWFDIVSPQSDNHVYAEYQLPVSGKGAERLNNFNLPETFPAVLHHQRNEADVYYFAGDFADSGDVPWFYQYKGFAKIKEWLALETLNLESSFFWGTYVPMMETIYDKSANSEEQPAEDKSASQAENDGVSYPSRINEQTYEVYNDGTWEPLTVKGVNMGMAKPGYFPGEAAISYDEYRRWFKQIAEMNANAIRVYTLHPPAFYEALHHHNAESEDSLYVFHGVWIDEEPLEETLDAFNEQSTENFQHEMKNIVDAIHGDASIDEEPGHAHGEYSYDVSPYVIGWVIGIEWYPYMVDHMEQVHDSLGDYNGTYLYTDNANPMEYWLAEQLDFLTNYEVTNYQSMRPLSFTNWVTTDNLDQEAEPSEQEDMAEVDPNHLKVKELTESVGMFASYHVYPYYPEFLNLEESYVNYIDHRGNRNNYAGYLNDLDASHDLPILIAEFGVPSSRGMTHKNPFGWNQGFISEKQQGDINVSLFEDILEQNMLGGLLFTWQDEWFKRTWNTMDYDNPDRRPYWSNAQTNEQHFGLLSFDRHKVRINGEDDWQEGKTLYEKDDGALESLKMDHDERYVYMQASFDDLHENFWDENAFELFVSIREDRGVSAGGDLYDFRVTVNGRDDARIEVAGDYDTFFYDYGERQDIYDAPDKKAEEKEDNFHPMYLALNKEITRPDTGEVLPFEYYETGELQFGIGDPDHAEYHSLSDYYFSTETNLLEIRIPWMLLNARDPSQKEFIGDLWEDGIAAAMTIEEIGIHAELTDGNETVDSFDTDSQAVYRWETWDMPLQEPRLKESYEIIKNHFQTVD